MSHNLHLSGKGTSVTLYQTPTEVTRNILRSRAQVQCNLYLEWTRLRIFPGVHYLYHTVMGHLITRCQAWMDSHPEGSKSDFAVMVRTLGATRDHQNLLVANYEDLHTYRAHSNLVRQAVEKGANFSSD